MEKAVQHLKDSLLRQAAKGVIEYSDAVAPELYWRAAASLAADLEDLKRQYEIVLGHWKACRGGKCGS